MPDPRSFILGIIVLLCFSSLLQLPKPMSWIGSLRSEIFEYFVHHRIQALAIASVQVQLMVWLGRLQRVFLWIYHCPTTPLPDCPRKSKLFHQKAFSETLEVVQLQIIIIRSRVSVRAILRVINQISSFSAMLFSSNNHSKFMNWCDGGKCGNQLSKVPFVSIELSVGSPINSLNSSCFFWYEETRYLN